LIPKHQRWVDYISPKNVTAVADSIDRPMHIKEPDSLVHGVEFTNQYNLIKSKI